MNLYMYPDHVYHLKIMYVYNIILYNISKDECMYTPDYIMSCTNRALGKNTSS